jgi:hypothetical protein
MKKTVKLILNQYQARNLAALLQLLSGSAVVIEHKATGDKIFPNNGDWLGEIRWMLEPQVDDSILSNFLELPDWAAEKGKSVPRG